MNLVKITKQIRYLIEALIVKFGLWFFLLLGVQRASDLASAIARFVGKKISVHKLAYKNLSKAMPNLSEKEKEKILDDMWDNLGRVVGEYPHICKAKINEIDHFVEISPDSIENLEEIKKLNKGGIIFSGHIGNWEMGPKFFIRHGLPTSTVYRPLNNPYVESITSKNRGIDMIPRSAQGNRQIIDVVKSKKFVALLADQKISEGEPVRFFHEDAITATSIAKIALKYDLPLIPIRAIRLGRSYKLKGCIEKPLAIQRTRDINLDILNLTRQINQKLEEWITQYPAQWFWVHNRWKK